MDYRFAVKTKQGMDVKPGDYFSSAVLAGGDIVAGSEGRDDYNLRAVLPPGKRVAGFGRRKTYGQTDRPSPLEAAPSPPLAIEEFRGLTFRIVTNIFLDQGLVARQLCLEVAEPGAAPREIPLDHPGVRIDWPARGVFLVTPGPL